MPNINPIFRSGGEENDLHPIQGRILRGLIYHPERKFSELNTDGIPSDQFSFHIKRLMELNLIRKTEAGYELTPAGKEFANRFDTDAQKVKLERQAKIGVLISCVRLNQKGREEFLIQQRLKQPYFGYHGFITGKMRWGETVLETAARELDEETGLSANLRLAGIKHKMDYHSDSGELLEDKFFLIIRADNPKGQLKENIEGGKNIWMTEDELFKLPEAFEGVDEAIRIARSQEFQFVERKYAVKRY